MIITDSNNIIDCWSKIKCGKGSNFFVELFYKIMFEKYPETKALFPENMKKQNAALLNMLDNVINSMEYIDEFEDILIQLGKRHQHLGVDAKMYDAFIEIVVEAAKQSSNYTLTESELLDWEKAFRIVSDIMQKNY